MWSGNSRRGGSDAQVSDPKEPWPTERWGHCAHFSLLVGQAAWGAAAKTAIHLAATSHYDVRLQVTWYPRGRSSNGKEGLSIVRGTVVHNHLLTECASSPNWSVDHPANGVDQARKDATYVAIDTSADCFGKHSKITFDVTLEQYGKTYGPVKVGYVQTAVRTFVSTCSDDGPLKSSCGAFPIFTLYFSPIGPYENPRG